MWPPDDEDFWTAPRRGELPHRPGLLQRQPEPEEPHYEREDESDGND